MEFIGYIIFGWIVFWLIGSLFSFIGSFFSDKTSASSGNINDHPGSFEIRLRHSEQLDEDDTDSPVVTVIEGRGLFPIQRAVNMGVVTSIFDGTSDEFAPIISAIEIFQEKNNTVFQYNINAGEVQPEYGLTDWTRVGILPMGVLQPPYSGSRKLVAIVRMVDLNNPPSIIHGFIGEEESGVLWQESLTFNWEFSEKGYEEASEYRDEAMGIAIKIGVAIAFADGDFDEKEGDVLKKWIVRVIEPFSDEKRQTLKALYNKALKGAFVEAKHNALSLSALTSRLNEIGEKNIKYEAVELCFDVMAADGIADSKEMLMIKKVSDALELDIDEIKKMHDAKIIGLNVNASIEELLGIGKEWDKKQIKKHLRDEYNKWNGRLNTLPEGDERNNAQRMLDLIGDARNKYV